MNFPFAKLVGNILKLPFAVTSTSTLPTISPSGIKGFASSPKSRCETFVFPFQVFLFRSTFAFEFIIPSFNTAFAFLSSRVFLAVEYVKGRERFLILTLSIKLISFDEAFILIDEFCLVSP